MILRHINIYSDTVKGFLAIVFALFISTQMAWCQPKSIGASFSFFSMGLNYEQHVGKGDSFIEASLHAEISEVLMYRAKTPGISGSFTWNIPFYRLISENGNEITFFAGPGAILGYEQDFKKAPGLFFGLKGRVGGQCNFARKVVLSISLCPVIGSHIILNRNSMTMNCYINGLIHSLAPEIGIKYRF